MNQSATTGTEAQRLAALRRYQILDTPREEEFDDFSRLAALICNTPISAITLVDEDRQWFKAEVGLGIRETPLDRSICKEAMLQRGLVVVSDTRLDPRFANNPLVKGEPFLQFYAGAALETDDGRPLGMLCVLDHQPRELTDEQGRALTALARQVMNTLELRLAARDLARKNAELEQAMKEIKTLRGLLPVCAQCKQIRDGEDNWMALDTYVQRHTDTKFTHGLCPPCARDFLAGLK